MTLSPGSIMAKSAIAWPTRACSRLASLAISTGGLMRIERGVGDGGIGGEGHDFYNAWCTPRMTQRVYRRPWWRVSVRPSIRQAAGCRSAPSWRKALYEPGPRLLRERPDRRRPHARGRQRLRHRARAVAAVRPRRWPARSRKRCDASGSDEVWEFGAGSGALAAELLAALGPRIRRYSIVELSAPLRERQRAATREHAGVVALARRAARADERRRRRQRGARRDAGRPAAFRRQRLVRARRRPRRGRARARLQRPADDALRPPNAAALPAGTTTETHAQGEAFVAHPGRAHGAGRGASSSTTAFRRASTTTRSARRAR